MLERSTTVPRWFASGLAALTIAAVTACGAPTTAPTQTLPPAPTQAGPAAAAPTIRPAQPSSTAEPAKAAVPATTVPVKPAAPAAPTATTSAPTGQPATPTTQPAELTATPTSEAPTATPVVATPKPSGPTPDLLRPIVQQLKQQTRVPVLIPNSLPADATSQPVYPAIRATPTRYEVSLNLTQDCSGASACSIGSIQGEQGGAPLPEEFVKRVSLAGNISGYFSPSRCGASCSPAVVGWKYQDTFYRISLKAPGSDQEQEQALTGFANSAITAGVR